MSSSQPYPSPINQLRQLGDPAEIQDWATYRDLGISLEHMADLARLAVDIPESESEDDEAFDGPIHAWRMLAVLASHEAVAALMTVLDQLSNDGNWWLFGDDLVSVFSQMGAIVLPPLAQMLADSSSSNTQEHAIQVITEIYRHDRQTRADCVAVLTQQLREFEQNTPELNAGLVVALAVDLTAVESASVITQAYKASRVDESLSGSWEQVQVDLGLRKKKSSHQKN